MDAEITPLFSIPFYRSKIDITENDIDNVKNLEYHRITNGNDGELSNITYLLELPDFSRLKSLILDHLHNYCEILKVEDGLEFYITNSWATLHKPNDGSGTHFHTNSLISGIVYIKCDENSGKVGFAKNVATTTIFPQAIDIQFKEDTILNMKEIALKPSPGDILLFPSHLNHWVKPSNSDQNRYVIAFDVFVKGNIGSKDKYSINSLRL